MRCRCVSSESTDEPDSVTRLTLDPWTWQEEEEGEGNESVQLSDDRLSVLFHPSGSMGAVAIRGEKQLTESTIAFWQIKVSHRLFGTSIQFGVGHREAMTEMASFGDLLGIDGHSWALSHKGRLHHSGISVQFTEPFEEFRSTAIGILFDGPRASLRYFKDGIDLGIAFTGLDLRQPLYPMIASTAARSEFTLGSRRSNLRVSCLQEYCMRRVLSRISTIDQLSTLRLPESIRRELSSRLETTGRRKRLLHSTGKPSRTSVQLLKRRPQFSSPQL